jgi:hypothetical protein
MRFSELDENFVLSELGTSPTMVGQPVAGQPVTPQGGVKTAAPVNQVSPQQQAAIMVKQKQDQRTQLQNQLKQAREAVTAAQQQVNNIQNQLSKLG